MSKKVTFDLFKFDVIKFDVIKPDVIKFDVVKYPTFNGREQLRNSTIQSASAHCENCPEKYFNWARTCKYSTVNHELLNMSCIFIIFADLMLVVKNA